MYYIIKNNMIIFNKMIKDNRKACSRLGDSSALASSAGLITIIEIILVILIIIIFLFSEKRQEEEVARGEVQCLQEEMARECNQVKSNLIIIIPILFNIILLIHTIKYHRIQY